MSAVPTTRATRGDLPPLRDAVRELRHPFDLAALISLFVLVLPPERMGFWGTVATGVFAAIIIVVAPVRRSPWPWLLLAGLHGAIYVQGWYHLDNHDLLAGWWALAMAVAAGTRQRGRDQALATQARWILGTVFAVATLWKLGSGQYVDGSFFLHSMVVDPRFQEVAARTSSVSVEQLVATRDATWVAITAPRPTPVDLGPVSGVSRAAHLFTAWGVISEAAIAIGMLAPDRPGWRRFRQVALLAFMLTTYAVVPVLRFAILLGAMGVAQAGADIRWRWAFLAVAIGALAWTPAWWYTLGP